MTRSLRTTETTLRRFGEALSATPRCRVTRRTVDDLLCDLNRCPPGHLTTTARHTVPLGKCESGRIGDPLPTTCANVLGAQSLWLDRSLGRNRAGRACSGGSHTMLSYNNSGGAHPTARSIIRSRIGMERTRRTEGATVTQGRRQAAAQTSRANKTRCRQPNNSIFTERAFHGRCRIK